MRGVVFLLALAALAGCLGPPEAVCSGPEVSIASFNIQAFGVAKMSDPGVAESLFLIIRGFDVVAVQEIRDKGGESLPRLAALLNYSYVVSPRLGSTPYYKEQYAFLYNASAVEFMNVSYVVESGDFERPPFVAKFRAGDFSFFLVNIHTKPERGTTFFEVASLTQAVNTSADYVIAGDFNAGCGYMAEGELAEALPGMVVLIPDWVDTSVRSSRECAYDRIVITSWTQKYHTGDWGVYRFGEELGLAETEALRVSDHYPVWASFYTSCVAG